MVHTQTRIRPRKWDESNSLGFWDTNRLFNPSQKNRLRINQKEKKTTCYVLYFAVPVDQKVERREGEKIDKYLDLARELKKNWNMVMSVDGEFGTVARGLKKTGEFGNQRKNSDHPDYSIVNID